MARPLIHWVPVVLSLAWRPIRVLLSVPTRGAGGNSRMRCACPGRPRACRCPRGGAGASAGWYRSLQQCPAGHRSKLEFLGVGHISVPLPRRCMLTHISGRGYHSAGEVLHCCWGPSCGRINTRWHENHMERTMSVGRVVTSTASEAQGGDLTVLRSAPLPGKRLRQGCGHGTTLTPGTGSRGPRRALHSLIQRTSTGSRDAAGSRGPVFSLV